MIRNGGALDGVRILAPRTVALMTINQVGTLHSATGLGFGLGFETTDRYGAQGLASVGSYRWDGAYGSTYLVDPEARLVIVYMMQLIPNRTEVSPKFFQHSLPDAHGYAKSGDKPVRRDNTRQNH